MYFIRNEDDENSNNEQNPNLEPSTPIDVDDDAINVQPTDIFSGKNNGEKRVYGRARANLCFSSFYIFCEDFRKQLDYVYAHESEYYRKSLLNHMWKHLNVRDKHKYYETATKARTMYNLPEHPYHHPGHLENDKGKSTIQSTVLNSSSQNSTVVNSINHSNGSTVVGKLVKVQFSKSCTTPIITPLKVQDVFNHLESVRGHHPPNKLFEQPPQQDHGELLVNSGPPPVYTLPDPLGVQPIVGPQVVHAEPQPLSLAANLLQHEEQRQQYRHNPNGGVPTSSTSSEDNGWEAVMLQQYQQQPDYTPYGGYGVQPNAGYFNYATAESSWYGSPSSAGVSSGDHTTVMHGGLSHNACSNTHIGDSAGNFLNHGYHQQTTSTAGTAATSSAESFSASNTHPGVSGTNMDPMADFLVGGHHQNMNETDKIIKEESIDWLSTIINDDEVVDHQQSNRQDCAEGGGGGGANGKLAVSDLPPHNNGGQEPNGRLPNFHQAFGSTEIGRFSQHEYYEPPKDTGQINGECQRPTVVAGGSAGAARPEDQQPSTAAFEPPRQQNRRGRTQRGGGQHRRNNKQTRTAVAAAAAAAAAAAQQYVGGYDVTGSTAVSGAGRHQIPPYHHHHHDPYGRNQQHAQQRYHHQDYHHHYQQPPPSPSYQHQQEYYQRSYERSHHHGYQHQQQQQQQQQQSLPPQPTTNHQSSYYNNNREQSYTGGGGYNRYHSCCSTEHSITRPNHHHNYGGGPGQYYGDYNTGYSQW